MLCDLPKAIITKLAIKKLQGDKFKGIIHTSKYEEYWFIITEGIGKNFISDGTNLDYRYPPLHNSKHSIEPQIKALEEVVNNHKIIWDDPT